MTERLEYMQMTLQIKCQECEKAGKGEDGVEDVQNNTANGGIRVIPMILHFALFPALGIYDNFERRLDKVAGKVEAEFEKYNISEATMYTSGTV